MHLIARNSVHDAETSSARRARGYSSISYFAACSRLSLSSYAETTPIKSNYWLSAARSPRSERQVGRPAYLPADRAFLTAQSYLQPAPPGPSFR